MKPRLSTVGAVLSTLCAFKVCCVLPSLLSLVGLAGSGAALVAARWAAPVLLVVSLLLIGRSFYSIYVLGCGSRASRWITWASVATMAVVWTVRLATPSHAARPEVPVAQAAAHPAHASEPAPETCPCRAGKGGS